MLVIPSTHIPSRPRLTPRRIRRIDPGPPVPTRPAPHTTMTEHLLAHPALLATDARLQHLPTNLAGLTIRVVGRTPGVQVRFVPRDGLRTGTLEFDAQLAQEAGMPFIPVRLEETVRLLVRKEVEDQGAQGHVVADAVVEDPGVAGRGNGVGRLTQARDGAEHVVAQGRGEQAVAQRVQVEEEEVLRAALGVAQVAVGADVRLNELVLVVRVHVVARRWQGGQVRDPGGGVVHARRGRLERAGVEPLQEPLKDLGFFFREPDFLLEALGEGPVERGGEEGRGGGEKFFVHEVFGLGSAFAAGLADKDGGYAGKGSEAGS